MMALAARFLYVWPERVPPRRPTRCPPTGAKTKLGMLYGLKDRSAETGERSVLTFSPPAAAALQIYRLQVAEAETAASGLFLSWLGKLPGMAVRLSNVLEHLYWCGDREIGQPPTVISERAVVAAIAFLDGYAVPMARRCFGEAALPKAERGATVIAKWITRQKPTPEIVNARDIQRLRLAGLGTRDDVHAALEELEHAGWVWRIEQATGWQRKARSDWQVNPKLQSQT